MSRRKNISSTLVKFSDGKPAKLTKDRLTEAKHTIFINILFFNGKSQKSETQRSG